MAYHFSAEQFDKEFAPHRLRNWEIPKWYPDRPCPRKGTTKIISNDRGHLLPGIKKSKSNPWGDYVGTWKLPKKITREIANQILAPNQKKIEYWKAKCLHEKVHSPVPDNTKVQTTNGVNESEHQDVCEAKEPAVTTCPTTEPPKQIDLEHPEIDVPTPYCPGDLTSPRHRHPSYEMLKYNNSTDKGKIVLPEINKRPNCSHDSNLTNGDVPPEIAAAISNFQIAKKFHAENLEHQPLPETVTDDMYRKYQMERHPHPGIALKDEPVVTGVGYKHYGGYSPTQCTKLKVYRPKTCAPCSRQTRHDSKRPSTAEKRISIHSIIQKEVTPIQLALCWDVIPENPEDEPKPPIHIDGSNGSAGPAIFTKVYSPKPPEEKPYDNSIIHCHPEPVFERVENPQSDPHEAECDEHSHPLPQPKAFLPNNNELCDHMKSMKISDNGNMKGHELKIPSITSSGSSTKAKKFFNGGNKVHPLHACQNTLDRPIYHSSPDLTINGDKIKQCSKSYEKLTPAYKELFSRSCTACELKTWNQSNQARPKSEYKMAFKAGKPNGSCSSEKPQKPQVVYIPKQRDPYVRRNYRISTLAPPFSLRPEKRVCDYPEHWRLASVYQHSYKPIHARKRPLLASVYL